MEPVEVRDAKIQVRYRYPEACCGRCIHAFQNEYGDIQCTRLPAGNTIDLGALCDMYHPEVENS